jgi:hypothetical protein
MLACLLHQSNQPGNHFLHEIHVAAPFAGGALPMTEVILHIDDNQHAVTWIGALFERQCHFDLLFVELLDKAGSSSSLTMLASMTDFGSAVRARGLSLDRDSSTLLAPLSEGYGAFSK